MICSWRLSNDCPAIALSKLFNPSWRYTWVHPVAPRNGKLRRCGGSCSCQLVRMDRLVPLAQELLHLLVLELQQLTFLYPPILFRRSCFFLSCFDIFHVCMRFHDVTRDSDLMSLQLQYISHPHVRRLTNTHSSSRRQIARHRHSCDSPRRNTIVLAGYTVEGFDCGHSEGVGLTTKVHSA